MWYVQSSLDGRKTINPDMRACMYASDPHSFWCDCTVYIVLRIWFFEHEYRKQTATHNYIIIIACYHDAIYDNRIHLWRLLLDRYGKKLLDLFDFHHYLRAIHVEKFHKWTIRSNCKGKHESIRRHMFYMIPFPVFELHTSFITTQIVYTYTSQT